VAEKAIAFERTKPQIWRNGPDAAPQPNGPAPRNQRLSVAAVQHETG
jgi:hypothetical protein